MTDVVDLVMCTRCINMKGVVITLSKPTRECWCQGDATFIAPDNAFVCGKYSHQTCMEEWIDRRKLRAGIAVVVAVEYILFTSYTTASASLARVSSISLCMSPPDSFTWNSIIIPAALSLCDSCCATYDMCTFTTSPPQRKHLS